MSEQPSEGTPYSSRRTNACAALSRDEFDKVVEAAELYVSARSTLMSFVSMLGNLVQRGMNTIPEDRREEILQKAHEALRHLMRVSIKGMDDDPGRESSDRLYMAGVAAAGAVGGAFGWPAVLVELPLTTGLMFRSIADVGRAYGGRLDDREFRATCIEVFAYGSPLDEDEEELAFLAAKLGAVEISAILARAASRYAAVLIAGITAASIPIIGGGLGAGVNCVYLRFYQSMARVLFILFPIEREYDPAQVRSCFASVVHEIQEKQDRQRRTARYQG